MSNNNSNILIGALNNVIHNKISEEQVGLNEKQKQAVIEYFSLKDFKLGDSPFLDVLKKYFEDMENLQELKKQLNDCWRSWARNLNPETKYYSGYVNVVPDSVSDYTDRQIFTNFHQCLCEVSEYKETFGKVDAKMDELVNLRESLPLKFALATSKTNLVELYNSILEQLK